MIIKQLYFHDEIWIATENVASGNNSPEGVLAPFYHTMDRLWKIYIEVDPHRNRMLLLTEELVFGSLFRSRTSRRQKKEKKKWQ